MRFFGIKIQTAIGTKHINEIIIVDDCSSDKTIEIIEKYKKNYPDKIKFFKNEHNLGFTKNFEKAISKSSGDVIFLSDQDDFSREIW